MRCGQGYRVDVRNNVVQKCNEDVKKAVRKMYRSFYARLSCRCKENFQADERVVEGKGWRGMERVNVVEGVEGLEWVERLE